jgi:S-adenosylmethionine/arginine decarboxylase-like enzyme
MIWLHIVADLKKIDFEILELTENKLWNFITNVLIEVWLTELWSYYHTFSNPDEITWVIALAESHITFHTWPEKDYVSLDIFVCNVENNNSEKAKKLYEKFRDFLKPGDINTQMISRKSK